MLKRYRLNRWIDWYQTTKIATIYKNIIATIKMPNNCCYPLKIVIVGREINLEREPSKKKQRNDTKKDAKRIKNLITFQGAIEKSPIMLLQYFKFKWLDGTIIISYFGGSNNIFADCTNN